MQHFQHPNALVESDKIGKGTRVWAFAHILPCAIIGEDCNICDHVFIENDVRIGDRVTVKCGVQIWDGITIEDDVFIGPNATFTNDPFPRSKQYPESYFTTIIRQGASIGANATLLPGITVGMRAMVGAGSVVTKNVPPYAIVVGNPARIVGYVQSKIGQQSHEKHSESLPMEEVNVKGVKVFNLPSVKDLRGDLSVAEYEKDLPFIPRRLFWVFDVPSKDVRGEHAHKTLEQFLICVKGSCAVVVDDGVNRAEILLDRPTIGLYIPPMIWGIQYKYSADAVLLVIASDSYDSEEYIRDYDTFLLLVSEI